MINVVFIQLHRSCNSAKDVSLVEEYLHTMESIIKEYQNKEKHFSTLVTFFLGFYASTMIARWWQQVSAVPTLDGLCKTFHGSIHLSFDDRQKGDNLKLEKQFKYKIARYCLLAWTMCLSGLSVPLKNQFPTEREYIKKGLLTIEECCKLNSAASKGTIDGWTTKWFVPLNWAVLSLKEVGMNEGNKLLKEHKNFVGTIDGIQKKLSQLTMFYETRTPHIQYQAITLAVWCFLVLGLISSQGTVSQGELNNCGSGVHITTALVVNFPFFQIMRYVLIFGWLRIANHVRFPFGLDR